eukprot:TRINITY_DN12151_c0_g2_i1.p2 TRINITY_DN12151_c0_g2~~TRINITY_DN12151_c0_g2_i1.p2  ORF type:complete len:132 (-),score=23.82 TRINITY_DN12151_c0_g2_i1:65-460(-)
MATVSLKFGLLALAMLLCPGAEGAPKTTSEVEVLHEEPCSRREKVRRGDEVTVRIFAAATSAGIDPARTAGSVERKVVVGEHNVPAINKGIVGMCAGDSRRISILLNGKPAMHYDVDLIKRFGGLPSGDDL